MVNAIGNADNLINAGQSVIFKNGKKLCQLNQTDGGILLFNTELNIAKKHYFSEIK